MPKLTARKECARYKQALEDIAEYSIYAGAREAALKALDLDQPLRKGVPQTGLEVKKGA